MGLYNRFLDRTVYLQLTNDLLVLRCMETQLTLECNLCILPVKSNVREKDDGKHDYISMGYFDLNVVFESSQFLVTHFSQGRHFFKKAFENILPYKLFRPTPMVLLHIHMTLDHDMTKVLCDYFSFLLIKSGARHVKCFTEDRVLLDKDVIEIAYRN